MKSHKVEDDNSIKFQIIEEPVLADDPNGGKKKIKLHLMCQLPK